MNICTFCGKQTKQKACPECNQETTPQDLVPARCLDCGTSLTVAPHLRTSLGQCEECANEHSTIIGLGAWDDLL
jgi:hypothetical protein